ncbi:unnamed protein product [Adineta steineri]|uniref:EF-hand domain-containing protein n=1 Tax=Adineta steineri TaxID=433720 RepID=A0A813Y407_9BILA|nr:unnamed protein product [Adineta steineri]
MNDTSPDLIKDAKIHQRLNEKHLSHRELFRRLDKNHNGRIEVDELLEKVGVDTSTNNRSAIARRIIDQAGGSPTSSSLSFAQFVNYVLKQENKLSLAFRNLDASHQGKFDAKDLVYYFQKFGIKVDLDEANKLVKKMDRSNSLEISYDEWRSFFMVNPAILETVTGDPHEMLRYWRGATHLDLGESPYAVPEDSETENELRWKNLVAGGCAGAVSRTATAPFDRLKVIMQDKIKINVMNDTSPDLIKDAKIHQRLNENHLSHRELFRRLDKNHNGRIEVDELLEKVGVDTSTKNRSAIARRIIDQAGGSPTSSSLSFAQFVNYVLKQENKLSLAFRNLDASHQGKFDAKDLVYYFQKFGIKVDLDEANKLVKKMDRSNSLEISYDEWRSFFMVNPAILETVTGDPHEMLRYWRGATHLDLGESPYAVPEDSETENELRWKNLVAGGCAGAVSRTATAPFDRLKVIMQYLGSRQRMSIINSYLYLIKEGGVKIFVILRKLLCTNPHKPLVVKKDDEWYQPVPLKDKIN